MAANWLADYDQMQLRGCWSEIVLTVFLDRPRRWREAIQAFAAASMPILLDEAGFVRRRSRPEWLQNPAEQTTSFDGVVVHFCGESWWRDARGGIFVTCSGGGGQAAAA